MRTLLTFTLFAFSIILNGQDSIFYRNEDGEFYRLVLPDSSNRNSVIEKTYYKSGQIKSEKHYSNYEKKILNGKVNTWYEDGKSARILTYIDNNLDGDIVTYWENGQIKRKDFYNKGKLVDGHCFNEFGKETLYYDYFIQPEYPGGINALVQFLSSELRYPESARIEEIEGTVIVGFYVDEDGKISSIEILSSISKSLDNEAIRVIKKMPKWKPGLEDGEIGVYYMNLPIMFKLK